jgi:hypothetical protein
LTRSKSASIVPELCLATALSPADWVNRITLLENRGTMKQRHSGANLFDPDPGDAIGLW